MRRLYVDTCAFVAAFEGAGDESRLLKRIFALLAERSASAVTSELTIAELLAPVRRPGVMSIDERRDVYLSLFDRGDIVSLAPVSRTVLLETVSLRALHPQSLPDAIHLATATVEGCGFFLSSDRHARRIPSALRWLEPTEDSFKVIQQALDA